MKLTGFILLLLAVSAFGFYTEEDEVYNLTTENFQSLVKDSEDLWLIEFYAPWCGHCKKLTPEFKKAAKGLKGFVKLGAVDMTKDGDAAEGIDVQGYPTLKWFGFDKEAEPEDFEGGRTSSGLINFATRKIKEIANGRIGNKKRPKVEKKPEPEQPEDNDDGDVVVVTDSNFAELVEGSAEPWFIEFYAPWCGHCKNLTPTWKKLATSQKGKINIAKVDATQNSEISQRFGVKGYPSLKFFPGGPKSDESVEAYDGGRDLEALEGFLAQYQPAKFSQLTSQEVYDEFCTNNPGVCLIVFVPPMHDSSVEQRQSYLQSIEAVANNFRGKPFTFLWTEGGSQFDLENAFGLGAGYPATLAVTVRKGKYAQLRQAFSQSNFQQFVDQVATGKGGFQNFNQKPAIKEVSAWDGQGAQQQRNEDL